jgi:hypothetical protein
MKTDLILPFYKPHEGWLNHLLESVAALRQELNRRGSTLRVILANDGSPKSCYPDEALDAIRAAADEFIFSTYDVNHGKGYCLRHAVQKADGDIQLYTDGDFPFGWQCAAEAFDRLNSGADVVMGVRGVDYGKALHPLRKLISKGVRRLNRFLLGMPERYLDTQAGMKGFRGAGKQAFLDTTVDTFLFDTEFILLAWDRGLRIDTIPLTLRPGLSFSKMGWRVLFRELGHFFRIMPAHWFRRKQHRPAQD